jgi:hypothetical protein
MTDDRVLARVAFVDEQHVKDAAAAACTDALR